MSTLDEALEELVTANRILAREGVVDSFGHVSIRHPERPDRYVVSRARAPELIEAGDLMAFEIDGTPVDPRGRKPYAERFIHGAMYEARPETMAVVHSHSPSVIPFGVTGAKLRPLMHMCASMGGDVPTWDSRDNFGDTNLLVTDMAMARDLAKALGGRPVALMRGHGCVVVGKSLREVVFNAVKAGLAGSTVLNVKAPMVYSRNFKPGFRIRLHQKDLRNALLAAESLKVSLPLTSTVQNMLIDLMNNGKGDLDHSAIVQVIEKASAVEVKKPS